MCSKSTTRGSTINSLFLYFTPTNLRVLSYLEYFEESSILLEGYIVLFLQMCTDCAHGGFHALHAKLAPKWIAIKSPVFKTHNTLILLKV